jgi:type II secretory pathway component PulF
MNKKPLILKLSLSDKILFLKNLSLLIKSGLSLTESLLTIKNNTKSPTLKYILTNSIEAVEKGQFLANSLADYEKVFGNLTISIIKVGELTGNLIENLETISEELKKIEKIRSKIITTMIYPAFLISIMIIIAFLIIYFLFPRLLPIFENLGVDLPKTTVIFISIVKFLTQYGLYIILVLIFLTLNILIGLRNKNFKYFFDYFLLKIPLISGLIKKYNLVQFSRSMGLLLRSGIKIIEALDLAGQSLGNLVFQKIIRNGTNFVIEGHSVSEYLSKYSWLFPFNYIKLIEVGEKTGNLENNFFYLSSNYEEELDNEIERFVNSLEPIILIIMSVIVGFMAISIIMPIYEISDKLQG